MNKEVPNGWSWSTIPEMIPREGVFIDGDWIESKDQDPNGEVRLIQLADIGDGDFKNKSSRFLTLKRANALNCTFLRQDDILVARMPDPIGRACLFPLKNENSFVTAVDVAIIRLGDKSVIPKYLMHSINNLYIRREIESLQSGTTRKRISRSNFAIIKFPLAPLPEQHRIVAKIEELFSSLDKGIESLKTAQQQLKVYRQAVLKWAFEGKLTGYSGKWETTTLGKIINISSGNGLTKATRNEVGQYLVYGGNGIAGKHSEYMYEEEKLIIGRVGVHCGNVHITKPKSWITDNAFVVSFNEEEFAIKYLYFLIISLNLNQYSSSTAQPVISQGKVYPIEIAVPKSKKDQQAIVAEIEFRLSVCDKIEESIEHSLKQSESLRQSILKKAFEGKLIPQDPSDEPASVLLARIKAEREQNKPETPPRRWAGKIKAKKEKS